MATSITTTGRGRPTWHATQASSTCSLVGLTTRSRSSRRARRGGTSRRMGNWTPSPTEMETPSRSVTTALDGSRPCRSQPDGRCPSRTTEPDASVGLRTHCLARWPSPTTPPGSWRRSRMSTAASKPTPTMATSNCRPLLTREGPSISPTHTTPTSGSSPGRPMPRATAFSSPTTRVLARRRSQTRWAGPASMPTTFAAV